MVQQVLGETKGERDAEVIEVSGAHTGPGVATSAGTQVNPRGLRNVGGATNPNFQQPYYQVHTYRPGS
jgi:hypothetical protein